MLIGIPTGIKIFNWLGTMYGGNIRFTTAMMFSVAFIVTFTIGGISGVMHASVPIDTQHQDTYFVVAHLHYVLFGGAIMGIFSGFYYWFPKMSGRFLSESTRQAQLLADLHRHEPYLLPDALPRCRRDAATHLHL